MVPAQRVDLYYEGRRYMHIRISGNQLPVFDIPYPFTEESLRQFIVGQAIRLGIYYTNPKAAARNGAYIPPLHA